MSELSTGSSLTEQLQTLARRVAEMEAAQRPTSPLSPDDPLTTALMDTIPDHIYFKDREGRFLRVSRSLARYFGLQDPEHAIGKTDRDFFSAEHADQALQDEQAIMLAGKPLVNHIEKETWPDGRVTWVSTTKAPLRGVDGEVIGILGISRDVTRQQDLERQIHQQERMAALGQLAGGIAHDFNNALMAIFLYTELVVEDPTLPSPLADELRHVLDEAEEATRLVRQILDFSRRTPVEPVETDLTGFIVRIAALLRRTLPDHTTLALDLPSRRISARADASQLQQVLMNLVINARDAMPKGGEVRIGVGELTLKARQRPSVEGMLPGDYVVISVSDTGVGIPEDVLPYIFEPFFTTKPQGEGVGLGLAQVYGIIQQHDGYIGVQSKPGLGTTMTIYLPQRLALTPAPSHRSEPSGVVAEGSGEVILVAEDEDSVRVICQRLLERMGYHVLVAQNGREALEVYRDAGQVDLILTDMVMPEMGGRELAEAARAINPHQAIVFMTGYYWTSEQQRFREEGLHHVIRKPLNRGQLAQTVRRALDGIQGDEENPNERGEKTNPGD
jgi:two-component system, cell cycle sensor histidine kinase and response regulator CckA